MNKEKIMSFIKGKEFYFVLLMGLVTVFVITSIMIYNGNDNDEKKSKDYVDLNTPLEDEQNSLFEPAVSDELNTDETDVVDVAEQPPTIAEEEVIGDNSSTKDLLDANQENAQEETVTAMSENVSVEAPTNNAVLSFNISKGLSWPIKGNVILPYSMEHSIYFETLDQYQCHEGVCIEAMIGDEVKAAAPGIIEAVSSNEETGKTVIINHGDGYKTVYGQLKNIQVQEGEQVELGHILASVEAPTKYFVKEGSHLYFKALKDEEPINPESLVK